MSEGLVVAGRYRILRELGRGGMGVVYLVEHLHTGDHLALKQLIGNAAVDRGAIERFKREARASARIKCENVVRVVDADTAAELGGAPFLVMELLHGRDLEKELVERGRISPADTFSYLSQVALALDKSHAIGLVHRDLKPENIFLHTRDDGTTIVKVVDFGISKLVGGEAKNDLSQGALTSTGVVIGTPLFMSPEQAMGASSAMGPTTDVWAMGLIALRLLTGEIYWRADTVAVLMVQVLTAPMYAPTARWAWLPPAIDEWFARSCAREPSERFARVGEQVKALGEALGLPPVSLDRSGGRFSMDGRVDPFAEASPVRESVPPRSRSDAAVPPSGAPVPGAHTTTRPLVHGVLPHDEIRRRRLRPRVWAAATVLAVSVAGLGAWGALRGRPATGSVVLGGPSTSDVSMIRPANTPAEEPAASVGRLDVPPSSALASPPRHPVASASSSAASEPHISSPGAKGSSPKPGVQPPFMPAGP